MRSIALSDLNRRPGEVVDMALAAPITLTKHGRRALVIMSAEAYDSMVSGGSAQKATALKPPTPQKAEPSFLVRQARKTVRHEDEDEGQ